MKVRTVQSSQPPPWTVRVTHLSVDVDGLLCVHLRGDENVMLIKVLESNREEFPVGRMFIPTLVPVPVESEAK